MSTYDMLDTLRRDRNAKVAAAYRKRRALAELRGIPNGPVPADPIRQRVRRLMALGWSTPAILAAARCDGTNAGLLLIANGNSRYAERKFQAVAELPLTLAVPASVPDTCLVPMLGAVRRVQALMALGWRHSDITPLIGRESHHIAAGRHPRMPALDWRVVDAAYDALSATPGPSSLSRARARRQGYAPPLAWDNIDDPDEQPYAAPKRTGGRPARAAAVVEEFDWLTGCGESPEIAADRLGVTLATVRDYRTRVARRAQEAS